MEMSPYVLVIICLGILFFISAIVALYWCTQAGQFKDFESGARSIFSEEEPEGMQTDYFPGKKTIEKR
ncbi:MAG: hypothetical protein C5B43_00785 [Verrucomicrobia bacterium]|nr:MAG: hypothetical protein C5B43_00785 [Verrucomicrobiota bacterium]